MKNVVFVVSDALCSYMIDKKIADKYVCPFVHDLTEEYTSFTNMYSEAPFTMGALISLLTGRDTFRDDTYEGIMSNTCGTALDEFVNNGYDIYASFYQDFLFPGKLMKMMKYRWLASPEEVIPRTWPYMDYYVEKLREGSIDRRDKDYKRLEIFIERVLNALEVFVRNDWGGKTIWYGPKRHYPWEEFENDYYKDRELFYSDRAKYIDRLVKGNGIGVFGEKYTGYVEGFLGQEILSDIKKMYKDNRRRFLFIKSKQFIYNMLSSDKSDINGKQFKRRVKDYCLSYGSFVKNHRSNWRGDVSARKKLDSLFGALCERGSNKPFFAYLHLLDTHLPFNFFSVEYPDLYESEFGRCFDLVKKMKPGEWKGNFSYLMSANYIDKCLEDFVKKMESKGLMENTVLVFVADHGYQYGDSPIRNIGQGGAYNWESFRVPCVVADFEHKIQRKIRRVCSTKDVFPTIFDIVGIDPENEYDGNNVLNNDSDESYANIEYIPFGQPDIYRKQIIYGLRNSKRSVVCKVGLDNNIECANIEAIYDLENDPDELINMMNEMSEDKIVREMIAEIKKRHLEIRNHFESL